MATLEIRLLGEFGILYQGAPVGGLGATRAQCLLAYLLLHRDAPISRQHLAFLFWPDSAESQARTNLRNLLHSLLQLLPESERFVQADSQTVQWRPDAPCSVDVQDFRLALKQAGSAEQLRAAIDLYTGDLLPECYDDWMAAERERLAESYRNALQRLADLLEGQGAYHEAIEHAQHLARQDPLRENVWRQIMSLYALDGDRAGVARAYRECRAVLERELDVEPSRETEAAYEKWKRYEAPAGQPDQAPEAGVVPARPLPPTLLDDSPSPVAFGGRPASSSSLWRRTKIGAGHGRAEGRTWLPLTRGLRLIWAAVLLIVVFVILISILRPPPPPPPSPPGPMVVAGCTGGSKEGLLSDPDVQRILSERYHLQVKYETMGSRDMVLRCATGYDFAWPGTEADVERFRKALGHDPSYKTIFNSALVLYSWAEITDALQQAGVVEQRDGVYYVTDTQKLISWLMEGKEWKDIGRPQNFGPFVVVPTDPAKSESGGIFAVYLASMLNNGIVLDRAGAEQVLPRVHEYYDSLGYLEKSTGDLFAKYLKTGPGGKPIIVAYESQGLELIQQMPEPVKQDILKKVRMIYPSPTVWVSHPLIALTPAGKDLIAAMKDPEIQEIGWKRHGFRTGVAGIHNKPEDQLPAHVPETIESFINLPQTDVMDTVVDALSGTPGGAVQK